MESITGLQNDLAVVALYSNNVIQILGTLFCTLKNYLILKDFKYGSHFDKNKSMNGLRPCFSITPKVCSGLAGLSIFVMKLPKSSLFPDLSPCNKTCAANRLRDHEEDCKSAYIQSQCYIREYKLQGELEQDILEFLQNHKKTYIDFNLTWS